MDTNQINDFDVMDDNSIDSQDEIIPPVSTKAMNTRTKLERRRRIEDINEERRLQQELGDF